MFSKIPPLTNISTEKSLCSMIKAFQLFHSTAVDTSYRSVGTQRKTETHCIFHYTVRGHGEVIYQGVPYITSPGEGFFNIINEANSGYGYPQPATEPWEFIVICFKDGNIRDVVKELLENDVLYRVPNQEKFSIMCKKLLDNVDTAASISFFTELVSMIHAAGRPVLRISSEFQRIVERDLLKNPTVSAIAAEMNLSREHLQREYFQQTGKTPAKYLQEKRFERLCYLLSTSATEAETAAIMHFSSVEEMRAFFKRRAGITPRRYRNSGYIII